MDFRRVLTPPRFVLPASSRARSHGRRRSSWRQFRRGVPTEAVLAEMRASDPPVQYLVGTPKGRLNRLEKHLIEKPWQKAREGVDVKLLAQDDELYVFAQSADRVAKERAMRRRQLKWLWTRLGKLASHEREARRDADEAGSGALEGADRLAPGRRRARQGHRRAELLPQSPETANREAAGGALPAAHQSDQPGSRPPMAVLIINELPQTRQKRASCRLAAPQVSQKFVDESAM